MSAISRETRWTPLGDGALFAARPTTAPARAVWTALRRCPGVVDVVLTEDVVCVHFDPRAPPAGLDEALTHADRITEELPEPRVIVVEARYDGPDLLEIARRTGLRPGDVARAHEESAYEVAMLGFLPGFAYLTGLDPRLSVPRRAEPRPRVPAGSIAIAAGYTAIYPFDSPGGWHVIGRMVDGRLFSAEDGARLKLGDRVRFERIA